MVARPQERVRKRPVWFSPFLLLVALTPAFLQTQYTCNSGDTRLASLEFEVLGTDRLAFDPMVRAYDLWLPPGATTATVRAVSMDPAARVTWYVPDGAGMLASGTIGVGGGEVTIDLPPDGHALYIGVLPPERAVNTYIVAINPACSQGSPCSDGNECTADYCDPGTAQCVLTPVPDDTACDFDGLPGLCMSGTCAPCPALTKVFVTPLQADVGDEITVFADASGVGPINYLWTATGGSFVDPSVPTTAYRCEEAGQQDLTITISDGTGSCTDENTVTVTCLGG